MSLSKGTNLKYTDFAGEFRRLVPFWARLEDYATDAIVRDAMAKFTEFWEYWENCAIEDGTSPIYAFVTNYIETVQSLDLYIPDKCPKEVTPPQRWTVWGTTLRLLEIGH